MILGIEISTFFYFGILALVAAYNVLQFAQSKGLKFVNTLSLFQGIGYICVIFFRMMYISGTVKNSTFVFWSTLFFFVAAGLELVEITLLYCGKIKLERKDKLENSESGRISKAKSNFIKKNFTVLQLLGIVVSLVLTWGVAIFSLMLITGYW
jgi:hypothetical protein